MDLSDGLATDLARLCAASGCGARIDPAALPTSDALLCLVDDPLPHQVAFGEDYELLFTAPPDREGEIQALAAHLALRLTPIGTCTADRAVVLEGRDWPRSWSHFQEER